MRCGRIVDGVGFGWSEPQLEPPIRDHERHEREADAVDLDALLFLDSSEAFDGWKAACREDQGRQAERR